jgi:class 3 adenylate cyclase
MPGPPSGTVTFLCTDIEGSTRLLQELGEGYLTVLSAHRRLLRAAFEAWGGREIDAQGDSFFVAFQRPPDAVAAAVAAQRALASHPGPEGAAARVRMGLHTGAATPTEGG